jgi:hypothetical protein
MTDQEVFISTLREARRIIGEYTGPRNANQTLTQLIAVLDRQDVAHAIERLEKGHEAPLDSGMDIVINDSRISCSFLAKPAGQSRRA